MQCFWILKDALELFINVAITFTRIYRGAHNGIQIFTKSVMYVVYQVNEIYMSASEDN